MLCFLFQIGEFYSKDPFELELALEFWCPSESLQHTSLTGSFLGVPLQRPPHKQVSEQTSFLLKIYFYGQYTVPKYI